MLERFRDEIFYQISKTFCMVSLRIQRRKSRAEYGLKRFNGFIQGNIKNKIRIQEFWVWKNWWRT